jgi:hypothetical protein
MKSTSTRAKLLFPILMKIPSFPVFDCSFYHAMSGRYKWLSSNTYLKTIEEGNDAPAATKQDFIQIGR